jgi:PAS domain S-box-containing protein
MLTIKSKIALGISMLFVLLLAVSTVAIIFINLLSSKTENLLTANYNTIRYCSEMSEAIDDVNTDSAALNKFEANLSAQEHNITEPGEYEATQRLRGYYESIKINKNDTALFHNINSQIYAIYRINQKALGRKNIEALETAKSARLWLTLLSTLLIIISFSLVLNFPGYIANPIRLLTEGIKEIAKKNYDKRIYLDSKDEFGEMADAFNIMAKRLYDYEHSNLSQIIFEKKRVETIINQMEDAVIGLDADNRVLFINHKAEELFNLKETEITGKYAPDVALHNDLLRTILQKNATTTPLKIITKGKESYFSTDYRTVFNEGKNIGEVLTLRDITSFKERDISKTNLLATISHELKTPISSIKMSAQLIDDDRIGKLNTEQTELIKNIEDDAERLLRITGELLNMTQIETGNIQLKIQKVLPRQIVNTAVSAVQVQLDQKNIRLEIDCPDDMLPVNADADKTSWVLVNFLTNAIKYTAERGTIRVAVSKQKDDIRFSVQDSGPGIEEKYLSRIFDRYFKVPGGAEKSGTGLGLAISEEFIVAQNGKIWVESEPGKGSAFSFSLPQIRNN